MPRWDGVQETIGEIQALKRQESSEAAHEMLVKVYKYVAPIMRKRRFRVHKLVEFLPKDGNLLGVNLNHGQRISLRLRHNHDPREFLSFESVLGTMLHELCHNVHGPHDRNFFALLDELTAEMESMMLNGYRGDPFIGAVGRPLASGSGLRSSSTPFGRPNPGRSARNGGRKLGGLGGRLPTAPQAIRERALQAAERRRQADKGCRAVDKVEELASDEDEDLVEISAEEFYSPRASPRASPAAAPPGESNEATSTKPNSRPALSPPEPEVISLLSDED